jgi:DNA polymerase-3 subunit alpha
LGIQRKSGQRGLFIDLPIGETAVRDTDAPPPLEEWPHEQLLAYEKETLGYYVSGHPLDRYAQDLSRFTKKSLAELAGEGRSVECKLAGIITDFRTRRTKKGELMAVFVLEDLTGAVETVVFPKDYARFESYLLPDTPVLVSGRFEAEEDVEVFGQRSPELQQFGIFRD